MEAALNSIRDIASKDENARLEAKAALQKLQYSLETVHETIDRYGHLHLQAAMVQTGIELGVFSHINSSQAPVTVDEVSKKTGAERQLIVRILRYLAAISAVDVVDKDRYTANHITRNLGEKVAESGLSVYFYMSAPPFQAIPEFLKQTEYKNPEDSVHTPFHLAFRTKESLFQWLSTHPQNLSHFNTYMALRRKQSENLSWLSVYPVEAEATDCPAERAIYVDIGGSIGYQCAQFKEMFPNLPGRVVLQDLPHSIARALPTPGVENMAHDFFTPQPVKGAKFYYIHGVLHNQSPEQIRQLLANTKAAMTSDSVLLVDELVLPEVGVNSLAASIDLTMLSTLASMERTEAEWRQMFADVGLEIKRLYKYNPRTYETVMDVRLP